MKTLKEAIQHCYEVAGRGCGECEKEHLQLAKWLEELLWMRKKRAKQMMPLSKREIRSMVGKPVWILDLDRDCGYQAIVDGFEDYGVYLLRSRDPIRYFMWWDNMGDTWAAYRQNLEEVCGWNRL